MSRNPADRLHDVLDAITAIRSHLTHGDLSQGLVYDAVRVRLIEIGEAVKDLPSALLDTEPQLPWSASLRAAEELVRPRSGVSPR